MEQINTQLTHSQHNVSGKTSLLSIIASDINNPANVGSLFRLCDALGLKKLYLCGNTATPPNNKINKTSRSTEKYVDYETHQNTEDLIVQLKASGIFIISLEITTASIAINSSAFTRIITVNKNKSLALILGSEKKGINNSLLTLSNATCHIPMYGNNSSMNVISAASIACFEITQNLL